MKISDRIRHAGGNDIPIPTMTEIMQTFQEHFEPYSPNRQQENLENLGLALLKLVVMPIKEKEAKKKAEKLVKALVMRTEEIQAQHVKAMAKDLGKWIGAFEDHLKQL